MNEELLNREREIVEELEGVDGVVREVSTQEWTGTEWKGEVRVRIAFRREDDDANPYRVK